jgi:clan AA aspartic protease (TIGR02281 family)
MIRSSTQTDAAHTRRMLITGLAAAGLAPQLVPVAGLAQTATGTGQPAPPTTVTVTGEQPVVSLQTWLDTYGRPLARVRVNGQGPFRFMVDTGSNTTVLARRTADRLGLSLGEPARVQGVTGSTLAPRALVQRLEIGNTLTENLRSVVFDGPAFAETDGILGMDMFAGRRVRFSFRRQEVEIEQSLSRLNLPISAPIRLRNGLLAEVQGTVGGVPTRFILDTGGELSVINPVLLTALTTGSYRRRRVEPAVIVGATQHELEGVWVALPRISFMGLNTTRLTVAGADAPIFHTWGMTRQPVMLVGMDILSQLETLVIDYRRRQVHLRLLASQRIGDVPTTQLG